MMMATELRRLRVIINRAIRIPIIRMNRLSLTTTKMQATPMSDKPVATLKEEMDTMMNRMFRKSSTLGHLTNISLTAVTIMPMPTIHTKMTVGTTKARIRTDSTRMNTIMINTTTRERLLASNHARTQDKSIVVIRRKTRRLSATSP